MPKTCLSRSLFKIFLILFKINKLKININGIEITKLKTETNWSKPESKLVLMSRLFKYPERYSYVYIVIKTDPTHVSNPRTEFIKPFQKLNIIIINDSNKTT